MDESHRGNRYLRHDEAAERLRMSPRTLHELARRREVPHRRPAGTRRLLYRESELMAWVDGAELETIETPAGGRVVRPKATIAKAVA